jgi:hypothetical protein
MKNTWMTLVVLIVAGSWTYGQRIDSQTLKDMVYYLASDELEGRKPGTQGEKSAAAYITSYFESAGLKIVPGTEDFSDVFTYTLSANPHGGASADAQEGAAINVAGMLDNGADRTIVIGAHYDHLGVGASRSTREENPEGKIHYGADDNASGVAGVMALASYFANNDRTENFNIIFVCFSAEELGLLGSKHFVQKIRENNLSVDYMLNMDMIGRLNPDSRNLHASGVGTSLEWVSLLNKAGQSFQMVYDSSGTGGSDHTSFYLADIPVLHFFTGIHSDYHKSTDTPDKINYEGQREVLEMIIDLVELTEQEESLTFQKTKTVNTGASRFKVTLGIMPDYAWQKGGVKLDGVTEGKPAQKAGIQAGDVIVKIGDTRIETIQDYMKILGEHNPGDKVKAIILRNEKELTLDVTF